MSATLKTRKPIDKLEPADFRSFPIWEFAADEEGIEGQDESWVRPVARAQVPLKAYSQLVSAHFTTSNGLRLDGFMNVTTAGDEVEIQPGWIVGHSTNQRRPGVAKEKAERMKRALDLWYREDSAKALGLVETDVFPLRYELIVKIRGEKTTRTGVVD